MIVSPNVKGISSIRLDVEKRAYAAKNVADHALIRAAIVSEMLAEPERSDKPSL